MLAVLYTVNGLIKAHRNIHCTDSAVLYTCVLQTEVFLKEIVLYNFSKIILQCSLIQYDVWQINFVQIVCQKLITFYRWMNQKDVYGRYLFSGGFLGMDNVSAVDRSVPPEGTVIEQVMMMMVFAC